MKLRTILSGALVGALCLTPLNASAATAFSEGGQKEPKTALEKYLRRAEERARRDNGQPDVAASRREPMRPWPVKTKDSGGTLIFSDSPEYVKEHGILYSDVVQGDVRIFYYHLNDTALPGKVAVVLENEQNNPAQVSVLRSSAATPSDNYLQVGKETEIGYMSLPQREREIYIESASGRVLSQTMNFTLLKPGDLVAGVYDMKFSDPIRVTIVFCPENTDPVAFAKSAKILPRDEYALRGTFKRMNRTVKAKRAYDSTKDGFVYIPIGDDENDRFKTGVDATDGTPVQNCGNYGVIYRFELPTKGTASTRMFLSPLGGVYAGALRVRHKNGERLVETPEGRLFFGEESPDELPAHFNENTFLTEKFELADLGLYPSYKKLTVEYSPPGASNLPALLILAPNDEETAAQPESRIHHEKE